MTLFTAFLMVKMTKNPNPISMAIAILVMSILTTVMLFKSSLSSWISFVTIMTFSSGMMTLFMYTASLSSNEKNKTSKNYMMLIIPFMLVMNNESVSDKMKETMKMFSTKSNMIFMMIIILITMLAISSHGHHPNQTLSSSF